MTGPVGTSRDLTTQWSHIAVPCVLNVCSFKLSVPQDEDSDDDPAVLSRPSMSPAESMLSDENLNLDETKDLNQDKNLNQSTTIAGAVLVTHSITYSYRTPYLFAVLAPCCNFCPPFKCLVLLWKFKVLHF